MKLSIQSARWYLSFGIGLLLVTGSVGCQPAVESTPVATNETGTVTVVIRSDKDREKSFPDLDWKPEMTALDALESLQSEGVLVRHRGDDETAFVEVIDGTANEVGGKNWIYHVNGKKAEKGAGVYTLRAGDVVLWKYTDEIE